MYINCHTHVFNFHAISSPETFHILLHVIVRRTLKQLTLRNLHAGLPPLEVRSDDVTKSLLAEWRRATALRTLLAQYAAHAPASLDKLIPLVREVVTAIVSNVLPRATPATIEQALPSQLDQFLKVIFSPTIADVAKFLFAQDNQPHALVALTMDISGSCWDGGQFLKQLKDTSQLILDYPGSVFPFVAVNPRRASFLPWKRREYEHLMKTAIEQMGFVGVKLYPSLGSKVKSTAVQRIVEYCSIHNVPIMVHCTSGGFSKYGYEDQSDPRHWTDYLATCESAGRPLKICFAHFGGDRNLLQPNNTTDPIGRAWPTAILDLINNYSQVYADLSYHNYSICSDKLFEDYTRVLSQLCNRPCQSGTVGDRILFGSDSIMLTMDVLEHTYISHFQSLPDGLFTRFALTNARRFLNLDQPESYTMTGYRRFLETHGKQMPAWLHAPSPSS